MSSYTCQVLQVSTFYTKPFSRSVFILHNANSKNHLSKPHRCGHRNDNKFSLICAKHTMPRTPENDHLRAVWHASSWKYAVFQCQAVLNSVVDITISVVEPLPKHGEHCLPAQMWSSQSNHSSPRLVHCPFATKEQTVVCHCDCW